MRVRTLSAILAIGLSATGCSDEIKDAEQQYEIVQRNGTPAQKCDAARKVAAAYLKAKDGAGYQRTNVSAQIECMKADRPNY